MNRNSFSRDRTVTVLPYASRRRVVVTDQAPRRKPPEAPVAGVSAPRKPSGSFPVMAAADGEKEGGE